MLCIFWVYISLSWLAGFNKTSAVFPATQTLVSAPTQNKLWARFSALSWHCFLESDWTQFPKWEFPYGESPQLAYSWANQLPWRHLLSVQGQRAGWRLKWHREQLQGAAPAPPELILCKCPCLSPPIISATAMAESGEGQEQLQCPVPCLWSAIQESLLNSSLQAALSCCWVEHTPLRLKSREHPRPQITAAPCQNSKQQRMLLLLSRIYRNGNAEPASTVF